MLGIFKRLFGRNPDSNSTLQPESQFIVRLTDAEVVCQRPDGRMERVAWDDLQRVEILNTPHGPFVTDVFWILNGTDSGSVIPWGATGERDLAERLFRLPRFNSEAVIKSASRTDDAVTLCWERAT